MAPPEEEGGPAAPGTRRRLALLVSVLVAGGLAGAGALVLGGFLSLGAPGAALTPKGRELFGHPAMGLLVSGLVLLVGTLAFVAHRPEGPSGPSR